MLEFLMIVEAQGDFRTAAGLAKRVFLKKSLQRSQWNWIEENLEHLFQWVGLEPGTEFSCWSKLRQIQQVQGYRIPKFLGHVLDEPMKADATMARRALFMMDAEQRRREKESRPTLSAIVFIRDMDNQPQRREGLEQARREFEGSFTIVIGAADPEREAWVLHGFDPDNEEEKELLYQLQKSLGFDPRITPERLRDDIRRSSSGLRDIKQVLVKLTEGAFQREEKCWLEADLDLLYQRGTNTGLSEYLDEVEEQLFPLFVTGEDE